MKKCTKCKIEKELSEFAKDKYNPDGLTYRCKKCRNLHYNIYYKENPNKQKEKNDSQKENRKMFYSSPKGIESSRRSHLKRNYGISLEQYNDMLLIQDNKCMICKSEHTFDRYGVLAVDHCHSSGEIRGLLCFKCNTILGSVNDDVNILQEAINYLNKFKNNVV